MSSSRKVRTNVTLSEDLVAGARALRLNVSAIAERALENAVREAEAARWQAENAEALRQRADWIATNGLPLADVQAWRP